MKRGRCITRNESYWKYFCFLRSMGVVTWRFEGGLKGYFHSAYFYDGKVNINFEYI